MASKEDGTWLWGQEQTQATGELLWYVSFALGLPGLVGFLAQCLAGPLELAGACIRSLTSCPLLGHSLDLRGAAGVTLK